MLGLAMVRAGGLAKKLLLAVNALVPATAKSTNNGIARDDDEDEDRFIMVGGNVLVDWYTDRSFYWTSYKIRRDFASMSPIFFCFGS